MKFEIGDRVYYHYGHLKGTVRERQDSPNRYRLDWDYRRMSETVWIQEDHLRGVPWIEQLAEQAK